MKNSFRSIYGDFNAGLLIFKKDDDGLKVLDCGRENVLKIVLSQYQKMYMLIKNT